MTPAEKVFNKWDSTGFLNGLEDAEQQDLAIKFEQITKVVLETPTTTADIEVVIYPITRRVNTALFKVGKQDLFDAKELVRVTKINFTKAKDEIEQNYINIDAEAMACKLLSNMLISMFSGDSPD